MLNQAVELFDELHHAGVRFKVIGGELQVTAPRGVLTDELRQEIVANKAQLVELVGGATDLLKSYGVQIIGIAIVLWQVADVPEVRRALKAVGLGDAEVRYLDDPDADIPSGYREFVPLRIQQMWDDQRTLGTPQERIEAERKARRINTIFDESGASRRPSRITGKTVLHGELARQKRQS
jgi:hypothetical protein